MICAQHGSWGDYCGPDCADLTRQWLNDYDEDETSDQ